MPGAWELQEFAKNRVLLATIVPPDLKVSMEWGMALTMLGLPPGSMPMRPQGMPFGHARNVAVKAALDNGFGWLLFVDADTIPPAGAAATLMAAGRDLIGGLYYRRYPPYEPAAAVARVELVPGPAGQPVQKIMRGPLPAYTPGQIIPVDFLPTGLTLISRRCLEAVIAKFPRPYEWQIDIDREGLSEDFDYCVKAKSLGFQSWLHTGVIAKHELTAHATERGLVQPPVG